MDSNDPGYDKAINDVVLGARTLDFFCDELRKLPRLWPTHKATIVDGKLYVMDRDATWQHCFIDDYDEVVMTMCNADYDVPLYEKILQSKSFTF